MALTKNPLIRYKILDKCFRNTYRRYFIEDLIDECNRVLIEINSKSKGISRRQILDDIAFMESSEGWSIDLKRTRDGKRVYFNYEDPNYSINNMPLNDLEVDQLQDAMLILSQFTGMPQFEWVHEMLPKLRQGIPSGNKKKIMGFESNQYLKGLDYLSPLYNSIASQTVLDVTYQDFKSENPYHVLIHPYYLKQYNNRWFLFGLNEENGNTHWNLALDRIQSIELTSKKYKTDKTNWEEYFDDVVGVTVPDDKPVEHIVLHFFGETGKYIYNKPLHGSQVRKWLDNSILEVRLNLKVNYELERLILSYADAVAVIKPLHLKNLILKRVASIKP
jgi:predicted DNA-binding transcriptional regulator YafY